MLLASIGSSRYQRLGCKVLNVGRTECISGLGIEYDLEGQGTTRKPSLFEERIGVTADACNGGAPQFF